MYFQPLRTIALNRALKIQQQLRDQAELVPIRKRCARERRAAWARPARLYSSISVDQDKRLSVATGPPMDYDNPDANAEYLLPAVRVKFWQPFGSDLVLLGVNDEDWSDAEDADRKPRKFRPKKHAKKIYSRLRKSSVVEFVNQATNEPAEIRIQFWYPFPRDHMLSMLRTTQHRLVKLSRSNRRLFLRLALAFGTLSAFSLGVATGTNCWMYTSERLKYYTPKTTTTTTLAPNSTRKKSFVKPDYFKNATLGPWQFCWFDPDHELLCVQPAYFSGDEPSDTTTSVEIAVRKVLPFLMCANVCVLLSLSLSVVSNLRERGYFGNLVGGVVHIFGGMSIFLCLIIYMASVSKEVGKKMYPATMMEEPMFYYRFGYSFVSLMLSFLATQASGLLTIAVYMAQHDEMMYNRYHIRSLFKSMMSLGGMGAAAAVRASTSGENGEIVGDILPLPLRKMSRFGKKNSSAPTVTSVPEMFQESTDEEDVDEGNDSDSENGGGRKRRESILMVPQVPLVELGVVEEDILSQIEEDQRDPQGSGSIEAEAEEVSSLSKASTLVPNPCTCKGSPSGTDAYWADEEASTPRLHSPTALLLSDVWQKLPNVSI